MADIAALKQKEKMLTEKIAKLRSGELSADYLPEGGRQEETIARNEGILRGVKKAINDEESKAAKGAK